jgi:DNA replicative helicase MCM subunit Mcm2 (Cdc46/Mcm family)
MTTTVTTNAANLMKPPELLAKARLYWPMFFNDENDDDISPSHKRFHWIAQFVDVFLNPKKAPHLVQDLDWMSQRVVQFNYSDFCAALSTSSSDVFGFFVKFIRTEPEATVTIVSFSLSLIREIHHYPRLDGMPPPTSREIPPIRARFVDITPHNSLREVGAVTRDMMMTMRGNVTRVSSVRPLIKHMIFQCTRCGKEMWQRFEYGKFDVPVKCDASCGKGGGGGGGGGGGVDKFTPLYESAIAVDYQKIKLQELEGDLSDAGRIPRSLDCELFGDLIDSTVPGDVVTISGILRALEIDVAAGKGSKGQSIFSVFLDVHSITTHRVDDRETAAYEASIEGAGQNSISMPSTPSFFSQQSQQLMTPRNLVLGQIAPQTAISGGARGGGGSNTGGGGGASSTIVGKVQFSERDRALVDKIKRRSDTLSLIIASCVPSIVGNETVKLGMLLGLFGGSRKAGDPLISRGQASTSSLSSSSSMVVQQHKERFNQSYSSKASTSHHHNNDVVMFDQAVATKSGQFNDEEEESVKASLRAASTKPKKTAVSVRSDPHVLIVGDPGMGKSQMLRAISSLAPRGVYVSGQSASTAGLTVTVVTEKGTGDSTLEAGALVLSDQGICAIDEFDKMKQEHHALLEAMEQQRVSVAKAGIVSSLHARASVMAAANPQGGHYDRSKTISENLKMSSALLSRFDLVFILLDKSDARRDAQLTDHVMSSMGGVGGGGGEALGGGQPRRGKKGKGQGGSGRDSIDAGNDDSNKWWSEGKQRMDDDADGGARGTGRGSGVAEEADDDARAHQMGQYHHRLAAKFTQDNLDAITGDADDPFNASNRFGISGDLAIDDLGGGGGGPRRSALETRLKRGVASVPPEELLPVSALRKYVAYARRHCNPQLLPEAGVVLCEFYKELRLKHGSDEGMPITTRQLESLLRLSEARAKIELAEFVTRDHALDVVELMRDSLFDAAMDEVGNFNFGRFSGGMSQSKAVSAFVALVKKKAQQTGTKIFSREELVALCLSSGVAQAANKSAADIISIANEHSYLLKRAGGYSLAN